MRVPLYIKVIALIIFQVVNGFNLKAQQWKNITSTKSKWVSAIHEDTIWVGSEGGLFKYLTDGTKLGFYTRADGLTDNRVTCVTIDSYGNKWIGGGSGTYPNNRGGVSKFDGTNWTNYNTSNSGLGFNNVIDIAIDSLEDIWIATSTGVSMFDGTNWINYNSSNSGLLNNYVTRIIIDGFNNKWFFSPNTSGIIKFDGINWTHYPRVNNSGVDIGPIGSIAIDKQNNIWFGAYVAWPGSRGGIYKFDGNNWTTYTGNDFNGIGSIKSVSIDSQNNKWFVNGPIIIKFDDINWTSYQYSGSSSIGSIGRIRFDKNGNKWFQTELGLCKFDDITWTFYDTLYTDLPTNNIWSVTCGRHGNKWFGTVSKGYIKYNGTDWVYSGGSFGVPFLKTDWRNNVWFISNYGSASMFDGTNRVSYRYHEHYDYINQLDVDQQGAIWFATRISVNKFDGNNWTIYRMPDDYITSVAIDQQNNKWFGTNCCGVSKFNETNWQTYNSLNSGMPNSSVSSIAIDKNDNKWFATQKDGIVKFDGSTWTVFNTLNNNFPDSSVIFVTVDNDNNIWAGTRYNGAAKYDGSTWTFYNTFNSGISSNTIYGIAVDELNNIWFATDVGISVLTGNDSTFTTYLQFNHSACDDSLITLNVLKLNGTPPYVYLWGTISGDSLSCNSCENPTTIITQNSTYIVSVTDSSNRTDSDTLTIYYCGFIDNVTNVKEVTNKNSISIYPNPTTSNITITFPLATTQVTTTNTLGQIIQTKQTGKEETQLNVSFPESGTYFVHVTTSEGSLTKKVIVLK